MIWSDTGLTIYIGNTSIHLFPLTIAVFLATFAVLSLGVVFLLRRERNARSELACNWKPLPKDNRPPFTLWRCITCGVEAYSTSKRRPPKECKRELKSVL